MRDYTGIAGFVGAGLGFLAGITGAEIAAEDAIDKTGELGEAALTHELYCLIYSGGIRNIVHKADLVDGFPENIPDQGLHLPDRSLRDLVDTIVEKQGILYRASCQANREGSLL